MNDTNPASRRFLIIQTAFIGDTILSSALAERLHRAFPDARIDLFIRKGNEGLFDGHPFISTLHVWDKSRGNKYRSLLPLLRVIRSMHYDYCITLQRHGTMGLLTLLSGAKTTVGFTMNPLSRFFTYKYIHKINPAKALHHELDVYHQLLNPIVAAEERIYPRLYPSEKDYQAVRKDRPYITIAPTSVWFTKQLPADRWVALADRIPAELTICLIGGPSDREQCETIKGLSKHPGIINFAGSLTLLQSAALISKAVQNFANDSSPVHIASSVDAPVTAVFCSTVPAFGYGPLSKNGRIVETSELLPCRPCGPHGHTSCPEGHFKCAEIDVDALLEGLHFPVSQG